MNAHNESFELNQQSWDERVEAHWASEMYRWHADALRAGGHTLPADIVHDVGDVSGKQLLHLQCHMGMETMMWSRLGASAVGIDFSQPAIGKANLLRDELGLDTRFFCANVYDAPSVISGTFDVVFVSIGSLCWLPDVSRWAKVVGQMLAPGGKLFLNDVHPMLSMLEDSPDPPGFVLQYPYLNSGELEFDEEGTYADHAVTFNHNRTVEWNHPIGEVVNALIDAGLRIDRLKESPRCGWRALKVMHQIGEQAWAFPSPWTDKIPVDFTVIAHK